MCWGGEDQREGDIRVATKPNLSISPVESCVPGSLSPTCPGMEEPRGKASPEWWR